ncbi:DUF4917 family protein [Lentzea sp. BCCO 10_0856]|uniref:DUF4917 family protein n=1 Tax=Lentzea miocenica TaxID=3095431 RepID=A0ABU4T0Q0_9PSEU|nr:DUF4917 family protein [Lentzea sp. BCCO 10_0856]MDX8031740.1 DUF4917 family protein [Lentzea sp. BCCO 10_0856]
MTAELLNWSDIEDGPWGTLLVGNGASINVSPSFGYGSLYEAAASKFDAPALALFDRMGTRNFEAVLAGLSLTRTLTDAVGEPVSWVDPIYDQVRDGLFDAVGEVHVPWAAVHATTLQSMATHLVRYKRVFTLNYDLLLYWAVQHDDVRGRLVDFMWSQEFTFDSTDTAVFGNKTALYHLHGGLHLWRDALTGTSGKWTAADVSLLDGIRGAYQATGSRQPLFVSEGEPEDKLRAIQRSDYLSFAYRDFLADEQPTVVFGAGLGSPDRHIVDALTAGPPRQIAISIYPIGGPDAPVAIVHTKTALMQALPGHELTFFDSTTHPLGRQLQTTSP